MASEYDGGTGLVDPEAAAEVPAAPEVPKFTQEEQSAFAEAMYTEMLESDGVQGPQREMLAAHYAAYRLSADLEELPFQEHVRLPLSRAATSDRVARFAGPFVTDRKPAVVIPVEGTPPEAAEAMQALLNQQFRDPRLLNGVKILIRGAKVVDFVGSCYVLVDWVQERRMRFGIGQHPDEELDLDGPRWRLIHPYDVYPDPRADDILTMRYIYIREEVPLKEFRTRVESGLYPQATPEAIEAVIRSAGIQAPSMSGVPNVDRFDLPLVTGVPAPNNADSDVVPEDDKPVYLFHRFTNEKWCTAGVTQDLLREVPLPTPDGSIPIRMGMVDPDLQGPNGVPPAEAAHGMNKNANSVASAHLEVVRRAGIPTMISRESNQDAVMASDIAGCPYEVLFVPDPDGFKPMEKGNEAAEVDLKAVDFYKYMGEIGSKSTDYRTGVSAAGAPGTATGTEAFQAQADTQFRLPFALFSSFVNDLFELTGKFNQAFLEKPQIIRRVGRIGASARTYEVSRPMLQGEFEYSNTAWSGQGDPQAAQGIAALVDKFGANPGLLNVPFLAREFAKAVRCPNPDKAVPAFLADPVPVEDAIEMVKLGLPVPAHPADDHMEFVDAFASAAMEEEAKGNVIEAGLLATAARERMAVLQQMFGAMQGTQDPGNPDGRKASDKGRPVPAGQRLAAERGAGMGGGPPGPVAASGRDTGGR